MKMTLDGTKKGPGRQRAIYAALIALLVLGSIMVYLPALQGDFIWDDDVQFTANHDIAHWKGIIDIWTSRRAMYFPLVLTTGWGLHKIVGFNPLVFHAVTLAFHIGAALLLIAVLRKFRVPGAWLAGFLFAWHPMQVESAGWICEMKNTQSAFFMLLSVLALQRSGFFVEPYPRTKTDRWFHRLAVALFVLAVLSKTSVVMLPLVLVVLAWWKRGVRRWADIDGLFPFFVVSMLASGWTIWEQRYISGAFGFEWSLTLLERIALAGQIVWFYLYKLVWPNPVMFLYPQWDIHAGGLLSFAPALSIPVLAALLFWKRNSWGRIPGVVLYLFALLIFPLTGFFNIYFMRYAWVADHFVYLASIPVFAAVGMSAAWLMKKNRIVGTALCIILAGSCAWLSFVYAHTFSDKETLWRSSIEKNDAAWMAHNNLGLLYQERGDLENAERKYKDSLEHNPQHYEAMNNLGSLYQRRGKNEEALRLYDEALALRPELYHSWINRGNLLKGSGDVQGAFESFDKAAALRPDEDAVWVNMAILAEEQEDGPRAFKAYYSMLKNKKLNHEQIGGFLYERSYKLSKAGRYDIALYFLQKAAELSPRLADIYLLRGILYEHGLDYSQAEKSYRMALNLRGDWGAVLMRLSRILAARPDTDQQNMQEALAMTEAMMQAGGDKVPDIVDVYAMSLAANGRYREAAIFQNNAISLNNDPKKAEVMNARLGLYQAGKPFVLPLKADASTH